MSPPHRGRGLGRALCPLPRIFFLILALNMVSFVAFWMVYFTVQLPVLHAKPEFNSYMRIKAVKVSK